jgi:hypothetical protein
MAVTKIKTTSSFTNLTKYDSFLAGNAAFNPSSYESIASATGTGASGTITFSSIPSTYASLQVRLIGRSTGGTDNVVVRLQYNSTAMTRVHTLTGNGVTVSAGSSNFPIRVPATNVTADVMGVGIIDIHDYASTTRNKTARYFGGFDANDVVTTNEMINLSSSFLDNTAAITSIDLALVSGSWSTNSQIALYGIKGA